MHRLFALPALALALTAAPPEWTFPDAPYRILIAVPPRAIEGRPADHAPASADVDFGKPPFDGKRVNLDSLRVVRYDPATGKAITGAPWPYGRHPTERASRFLDLRYPWDFPRSSFLDEKAGAATFPRGAYLTNIDAGGERGVLTWDHKQIGNQESYYAVYFDGLAPGQRQPPFRQGMVGDGSPRRAPEGDTLSGSWYSRLTVEDWDEDGLDDLIVAAGTTQLLLFRNQGTRRGPRFTTGDYLKDAHGRIISLAAMMSPESVDWDGDGKRDLLVGVEGGKLVWFRNMGNHKLEYKGYLRVDGRPLVMPIHPNPEAPFYTKDYAPSVLAADWDADGDPDLLLGGYITGRIWLYETTGRESDGTPILKARGAVEADGTPIDTMWGAHPCLVDLDGDGDLDLLTGAMGMKAGGGVAENPFLLYFENIGSRGKPKFTRLLVEYDGAAPKEVNAHARPFDWNGDGLPDLVIGTAGAVYRAVNTGTRTSPRWKLDALRAPWGLAPLNTTQIIDVNHDGAPDLILSPLDEVGVPRVRLNRNQGTEGMFAPPEPLLPNSQTILHPPPYGDGWDFVFLDDFDRDGDLDILWADAAGNVFLHRNLGKEYDRKGEMLHTTSGKPVKVGPPVVPIDQIKDFTTMQNSRAALAVADFDGDGTNDLTVGDAYGDVYVFFNRGSNRKPVFAEGIKIGNLRNRAVPLAHDWDHDGRVDVVVSAWSGQMQWFRNLGRSFAPGQSLPLPPTVVYSPRLLIADWNGDGDDDFLIQSSYPWFCWLDGSYARHGYAKGRILAVESRR